MKRLILILFFPFTVISQEYDQGIVWGGQQADNASRVVLDNSGDIICSGTYTGTSTFPGGSLSGFGFQDIFITKTSSDGSPIWQIGIGGANIDQSSALAVDANGDIFIAGRFQSSIDLDPSPVVQSLTSSASGALDGFIAKYSGIDGALMQYWDITSGGIIDIRSIAIDDNGDIFLAGQFTQTVDFNFGPGTTSITSFLNSGDGFVARYSSSMNLAWVNPIASNTPAIDYLSDVKLSADGSLYVTGLLGGTADIDPGVGQTNLVGAIDAVLIRYAKNTGSLLWGFVLGGNSIDLGLALYVTEEMDIVLTGSLNSGSMDVDPGPASVMLAKTSSSSSPFIARYTANREFVNASVFAGSAGLVASVSKLLPGLGNTIIATGIFSGSINVGLEGDSEMLVSDSTDSFVAQYNADWTLDRFIHIGGSGDQILNDAAISGNHLYGAAQINALCRPNLPSTFGISPVSSGYDATLLSWNMVPIVLATESTASQDIKAFPNPCVESFTIVGLKANDQLRAINMQGKSTFLNNQQGKVDVSFLPVGLYVIEIMSAGKPNYTKIIKQ
jgi:hypothetical protein